MRSAPTPSDAVMGRFRASSLGSGAIILALLLLVLHRNGTGLLFLVVGGALLWYGRMQRETQERAAREREGDGHGDRHGNDHSNAAAKDDRDGPA